VRLPGVEVGDFLSAGIDEQIVQLGRIGRQLCWGLLDFGEPGDVALWLLGTAGLEGEGSSQGSGCLDGLAAVDL
jgi:hypothetical protein